VDGRFVFGDGEREFFAGVLRKLERYSGIRVLTHCVMGNHFHVLVEVPDPEGLAPMDAATLLERVQALHGVARRREVAQALEWARERGDAKWEAEIFSQHERNMGRLDRFMKMLKQRFTMWYNRTHGRRGTLWEERYRSVLVEGSAAALRTLAAYIDLNPVRAGLVEDPKDYRWSGYGEAVAGLREARSGLGRVYGIGGESADWRHVGRAYRKWVYAVTEVQPGTGSAVAGVIPEEKVREVLAAGGRLPLATVIRVRVRYFSDGLVLGSREFVEGVFTANRERFGERRRTGARRMRGVASGEDEALNVLRDLRVRVFG
jgi:REP element-mobilizing transposase RayT